MQKVWETSRFREIYDVNTTLFENRSSSLRVQSFCHSISHCNWEHYPRARKKIMAFMVLSGEQCIYSPNGTKEKISAGYFTLKDFRNCDRKLVTTSETAERYFILLEANSLLDSMVRVMFPAGLPGFTAPAPEKLKAFFEEIRNRIAGKDASDSNISGAAYALLPQVWLKADG